MSKWNETILGDCISVSSGEGLSEAKMKPGSYLVYGGNGFIGFHDSFLYPQEKLIIGRVGAQCGNVHITKNKSWITDNALIVTLLNTDDDLRFWFYLLSNSNLRSYAYENAQPVITGGIISKIKTKIPSPSIQQKIAKILNTADTVIEKTQTAIAKYKAIKQGMLNDLFTRGIDVKTGKLRPKQKDAPELYKESALGWIPKEWDIQKMEKIAILQGGFAFSSSFDSTNGVKWMKIANVGFNEIKWNDTSYLPLNFIEQYSEFLLKENDLVIAMTRPIIRKNLKVSTIQKTDLPALLNQRVGRFIVFNKQNVKFVKYLMQYSKIITQIELEILGTDPPNVSSNQINGLDVLKANEDEMHQIGFKLEKIDQKIQTEESYLNKLQQIKLGLMADLLSGKKLVTVPAAIAT